MHSNNTDRMDMKNFTFCFVDRLVVHGRTRSLSTNWVRNFVWKGQPEGGAARELPLQQVEINK